MAEAYRWYEGRSEGLGEDFLTAVEEVYARIQDSPEIYAAEYSGVRRAACGGFPYVVYFRFAAGVVEIRS